VGLNSLKSLNLTKGYPNKNNKNKNKVKSKPLELRSRVKIFIAPANDSREESNNFSGVLFCLVYHTFRATGVSQCSGCN
jgi:hypothetical protein